MKMHERWEKNLEALRSSALGDPASPKTLLKYWQMQAQAGYPSAEYNVKYYKERVRMSGQVKSINIVLSNGQDGYSALREHIIQYWEVHGYATAVVSLATSSDGRVYRADNEIVSPHFSDDGDVLLEYLDDWWEGEEYITILGIKNLCEINICESEDTE